VLARRSPSVCHGDGMKPTQRGALDDLIESRLPVTIDAAPPGGPRDSSLHVDTDAICPRCLRWIEPEDYLRLTAFGLLQHEACPC
jgi:hypothetical protein